MAKELDILSTSHLVGYAASTTLRHRRTRETHGWYLRDRSPHHPSLFYAAVLPFRCEVWVEGPASSDRIFRRPMNLHSSR